MHRELFGGTSEVTLVDEAGQSSRCLVLAEARTDARPQYMLGVRACWQRQLQLSAAGRSTAAQKYAVGPHLTPTPPPRALPCFQGEFAEWWKAAGVGPGDVLVFRKDATDPGRIHVSRSKVRVHLLALALSSTLLSPHRRPPPTAPCMRRGAPVTHVHVHVPALSARRCCRRARIRCGRLAT